MFSFEHTRIDHARHIPRLNRTIGEHDGAENDSYKDYVRYAEHCLNMTAGHRIRDRVAFSAKWPPNG